MQIAIVFVALAFCLMTGLVFLIKKLSKSAMEEVYAGYPEHTRILTSPMANCFGLKSGGMKHVRGNGILLLTSSELYFRMLLPKKEILVPLRSIISVETPGSFPGKTKGRKLLKIDFRNITGGTDSAAWLVDNLEKWVESIRESAELN